MKYPVMEHFYTIQGEGVHAGKPAYFVRLAGCDVGCVWCDVKESWPTEGYATHSPAEICGWVEQTPAQLVVITGGEPAMYDCSSLVNALKEKGYRVHVETSAAYPLQGDYDWICISPKKFKQPVDAEMQRAHELKVIVFNDSDFQWAEQWAQTVNPSCALLLQAEWDKREKVMPKMIEYVKSNPQWRICIQTHKIIQVP
ncbi:MAG: 7-carboxy-7-deazaguanine synthase QueE [Sphingomonadales bacterium]|nr:7-carboxy-7-deazaguanine synthase QueE [Sphingomonadales bacterium]